MMRQQAVVVNGITVIQYIDKGCAKAVIGHGRPLGYVPGGGRQLKLGALKPGAGS